MSYQRWNTAMNEGLKAIRTKGQIYGVGNPPSSCCNPLFLPASVEMALLIAHSKSNNWRLDWATVATCPFYLLSSHDKIPLFCGYKKKLLFPYFAASP